MKKLPLFLTALSMLPPPLFAAWQGFLAGEWGIGDVSGFVQTPRGGTMGTTSMERPTFSEVGIHTNHFFKVGGGLQYQDYFTELNYTQLHPHGNTLLAQDLITHSKFISAGSPFSMQVNFDWTSLSFGKFFAVRENFQVAPLLTADWMKYDYSFSSPNASSSRVFTLFTSNVGIAAEYAWKPFSITFQGLTSIPAFNLHITQAVLGLNYHYPLSSHTTLIPTLKFGAFHLDFEDHQPMPNHVRYQLQPYGSIGFYILKKS